MAGLNIHGVNPDAIRDGNTVTYTPVVAGDPDLSARVQYRTADACHVITDGRRSYAIAWHRITGHTPGPGRGTGRGVRSADGAAQASAPSQQAQASQMGPELETRRHGDPWEVRPDELWVNGLAGRIQAHVGDQPSTPAPVELYFDARPSGGGPPVWQCRFVTGLIGGKRLRWARAQGPTVEAALRAARDIQQRG